MTKEQKRPIDQHRQSDMKYSEFARTIGLPKSRSNPIAIGIQTPISASTHRAIMPAVQEADHFRQVQTSPLLH